MTFRRQAPLALEPRVRGYRVGQVYSQADGALIFPVRPDLDTQLSKIDPALIRSTEVIPGPYGATRGPGFAFLDVYTSATPRYEECPELHGLLGFDFRGNGGQTQGRLLAFGGDQDYGFIAGYGIRTGSDYAAGDGTLIPSSYHSENVTAQFGFHLAPDTTCEIRYRTLDQWDTEYAGQLFDVRTMDTDDFLLTLVDQDPAAVWSEARVEGWFNRTQFFGDTLNASKRAVTARVDTALETAFGDPLGSDVFSGFTDGDAISQGVRLALVFGEEEEPRVTVGADVRQIDQQIDERFQVERTAAGETVGFSTNLPRAQWGGPGLFLEAAVPWSACWTSTLGGRTDLVRTSADYSQLRDNTSLGVPPNSLNHDDTLRTLYLVNELSVCEELTLRSGIARAERAPTPIERYADGLFLGIIQSGFSRVIGNPNLPKEQAWQIDATLEADFGRWRGSLNGFYAWISDYSTFSTTVIPDPTGARILLGTATDLATLSGFEIKGEYEISDRVDFLASVSYLEGRDEEIDAPLPGISPLEGRLGFRLKDLCEGKRWGLEFGVRIVDNQDRLGTLRLNGPGPLPPVVLEQPTPGFTTAFLRGYYNLAEEVRLVCGVENLFDRNYLEHLDLRLPPQTVPGGEDIPEYRVLSPGTTAFIGLEWML